jgi:RNA polymerase sigma-70 factor (ECF subfamily)
MDGPGRESVRDLFDAYFSNVWAYAVSRVGRQAAEDVVADTFAIAWRRRDAIPPDPLPWLIGVARNVIRDSYRGEQRRQLVAEEMQRWVGSHPDIADRVVEQARALSALAELPDADQELLMLVAWHGLSSEQAADVISCSRATLFVRLHRARNRLEDALRDKDTGAAEYLPVFFDKEISL